MKKESRFSSLIECYKSGFNPYQILGLTPNCTDEDIMTLWLKFKGEHISQEVMKSFYILLTPSNRFVYDELMKYDPDKDNFSDKYVIQFSIKSH